MLAFFAMIHVRLRHLLGEIVRRTLQTLCQLLHGAEVRFLQGFALALQNPGEKLWLPVQLIRQLPLVFAANGVHAFKNKFGAQSHGRLRA